MDPTDYRPFYLCREVKQRKRTTSAQFKVLEGIFERDIKPNAALRTELAAQLNMTARGVQVRFFPLALARSGRLPHRSGSRTAGQRKRPRRQREC
jgi:hypothetical protein